MKRFNADIFFMKEAFKEALSAFDHDEVPVGAVIVHNEKIIARAHNQIRVLKDPTAHAEMIAITQASSYLGSERLMHTTLYVTMEPCVMCAGAMVLARIKRLVYGAADPKTGACGSIIDISVLKGLNHKIEITDGVLRADCADVLKKFFKNKRRKK